VIGVLGNKVGMTQIFTEDGDANPVTVIRVGPCIVTQIKTKDTDGYNAIQIGYHQTEPKRLTKPEIGHLKKSQIQPLRYLKEYPMDEISDFTIGQVINVGTFEEG
jgi:large subunit ribosomal protein L3